MTLRVKILVILLGVVVAYGTIIYAIQCWAILPEFTGMEQDKAREDLIRCTAAVRRELDHLDNLCKDWAAWDDTYQFIEDRSEHYQQANLAPNTLSLLDLDWLCILDASGTIVWAARVGPEKDSPWEPIREVPVQGGPYVHALLAHTKPDSIVAGIVPTPSGAALVVSRPIIQSSEVGPIRGTFMMARALSDDRIRRLAEQTRVNLNLVPLAGPDVSDEMVALAVSLSKSVTVRLDELAPDRLRAATVMRDVLGAPGLLATAEVPRDITATGDSILVFALGSTVVAGLVLMLVTMFVLQRTVFGPLTSLLRRAVRLAEPRDTPAPPSADNEIGLLALEMDRAATALEDREGALRRSREQYHALVDNLPVGVYRCMADDEGRWLMANPAMARIAGYDSLEEFMKTFAPDFHPDPAAWRMAVRGLRAAGRTMAHEAPLKRRDGSFVWVSMTAQPATSADGDVVEGVVEDISARKEAEQKAVLAMASLEGANARLNILATTDGLTGLWNRRLFDEMLVKELARVSRSGLPLSLAVIDVDYLKAVNDTYGHVFGDRVLATVGRILRETIRTSDAAARFAGDEFVVLMPETTETQAVEALDRFRVKVKESSVTDGKRSVQVGISAGIAAVDRDTVVRPESFVVMADDALYAAKHAGRNRIQTWSAMRQGEPAPSDGGEIEDLRYQVATLSYQARDAFVRSMWSLIQALEARDRYTRGHSENVMRYAIAIAETMGLESDDIDVIRRAAMMHDVGKIGTPDAILRKPGPLTGGERRRIEEHVINGVRILEQMRTLEREIPLVRSHHERWDGKGYPDGLAGETVPLGARILAVADTFDAITSDRVYRKGRGVADAVRILREESGRQVDGRAVDALITWIGRTTGSDEIGPDLRATELLKVQEVALAVL